MTSRGENSRGSIFNCSDSIFEKSRISLMIFSSRLEVVHRRHKAIDAFRQRFGLQQIEVTDDAIQRVRSSWLTVAGNIDFDWLACSATGHLLQRLLHFHAGGNVHQHANGDVFIAIA